MSKRAFIIIIMSHCLPFFEDNLFKITLKPPQNPCKAAQEPCKFVDLATSS